MQGTSSETGILLSRTEPSECNNNINTGTTATGASSVICENEGNVNNTSNHKLTTLQANKAFRTPLSTIAAPSVQLNGEATSSVTTGTAYN